MADEAESVFNHMRHLLDITFSPNPVDMYDSYTTEWASKDTGGTMPPGPLVKGYALSYNYSAEAVPSRVDMSGELPRRALYYDIDVDWEPWVGKFAKVLEPHQITHRSRILALASGPLRINELDRQVYKVSNIIDKVRAKAMPERISLGTLDIIIDEFIKALKTRGVDLSVTRKYSDDHKGRSMGNGYRWDDAVYLDISQWRELFDKIIGNLEDVKRMVGMYNNIRYFTGIRARSDELTSTTLSNSYNGIMRRSRRIMFNGAWSMLTAFLSHDDKRKYYEKVYARLIDYFNASGDRHFPYVEGGEIYLKAAELFSEGKRFQALDGVSWEAFVGTILGAPFNAFMTNVKGINMLPSGITFTSLLDTIAMLWVTKDIDGTMIQLGDDFNHWGTNVKETAYLETAPLDTKWSWLLGLDFSVDPYVPRLSGFKISMDKTGEIKTLPMQNGKHYGPIGMFRKRDPRIRAVVAGAYGGHIGETTILDAIKGEIKGGDFFGGTYEIEQVILKSKVEDPYHWIDAHGLKSAFVS